MNRPRIAEPFSPDRNNLLVLKKYYQIIITIWCVCTFCCYKFHLFFRMVSARLYSIGYKRSSFLSSPEYDPARLFLLRTALCSCWRFCNPFSIQQPIHFSIECKLFFLSCSPVGMLCLLNQACSHPFSFFCCCHCY